MQYFWYTALTCKLIINFTFVNFTTWNCWNWNWNWKETTRSLNLKICRFCCHCAGRRETFYVFLNNDPLIVVSNNLPTFTSIMYLSNLLLQRLQIIVYAKFDWHHSIYVSKIYRWFKKVMSRSMYQNCVNLYVYI